MLYSIIIPVYNRPDEIEELLQSLTHQSYKDFEVLIIEDGSEISCKNIAERYSDTLNLRYYFKENSGQGFSRNYGFERANGDYFVVFDSDCIIPPHYFESVTKELTISDADCWGGPDKALPSFTPLQRAINYSMTSFLTTGGIRGGKRRMDRFHPRSFNMGISRKVYIKTGGYKITRMGEDIEFSIRIIKNGFKTVLMNDAYVYHKRRTNFRQFYRQLKFFGRARINITRFYPDELKLTHIFPLLFFVGYLMILPLLILSFSVGAAVLSGYAIYSAILLIHSYSSEKSLEVAVLSVVAMYIQFTAYGTGLLSELYNRKSI